MKLLDIDKVFEARINLGIPEDTEHFLHLLSLCWEKYGEPTTMQNPEELKNEVARLQKTVEAQDREEIRQRQAYETIKECFDGFLIELLDRYIAALKEE